MCVYICVCIYFMHIGVLVHCTHHKFSSYLRMCLSPPSPRFSVPIGSCRLESITSESAKSFLLFPPVPGPDTKREHALVSSRHWNFVLGQLGKWIPEIFKPVD